MNIVVNITSWAGISDGAEHSYAKVRLTDNSDDIFVWETEGIKQLKNEDRKNTLIIFVNTPMDIRIKRMKERGWELYDIFKRLQIDRQKFKNFTNYDFEINSL